MSRVRRVSDRREMERRVDEYITRGYRITSEGESSTQVKEKDWGDAESHLLLLLITGWWSFGLLNALYAIYRYVTAEEVLLKVDEGNEAVDGDGDGLDTDDAEAKKDGAEAKEDDAEAKKEGARKENAENGGFGVSAGDGFGSAERESRPAVGEEHDGQDVGKRDEDGDVSAEDWDSGGDDGWNDDGTDEEWVGEQTDRSEDDKTDGWNDWEGVFGENGKINDDGEDDNER